MQSAREVDDAKSSWPWQTGLHLCDNGSYKEMQLEQEPILKANLSTDRKHCSETRAREVGIASNRGVWCRGEDALRLSTHRPSRSKRGRA